MPDNKVVRCMRCGTKASGSWWVKDGKNLRTADLCAKCGLNHAEDLIHTYSTALHIAQPIEDITEVYDDVWRAWLAQKRAEWRAKPVHV